MSISRPFRYFDRDGECEFPTRACVHADLREGKATTLLLDANVCLDLSNYARGRTDAVTETRVRTFLLAIRFAGPDVVPSFGCLELACKRDKGEINQHLLGSLLQNVGRALDQTEFSLTSGGTVRDAAENESIVTSQSISSIYPMLRYAYCCFLRIIEIRSRGHLKPRAVKNFVEFYDWCEDMKCHMALVSQAALALFGGSMEAQALINVKKDKTALDAAWRAAWDFWHAWTVQNYFAVVPIDGVWMHPIFVTRDDAAAYVAGRCIPRALFRNDGVPFLSECEVDAQFPYYGAGIERLVGMLRSRALDTHARVARGAAEPREPDHSRVSSEIERLERAVLTAS